MTLIICTAGTSIAGAPRKRDETLEAFRERMEANILRNRTEQPNKDAFLIVASAETHGLVRAKANKGTEVALLTTETEEGRVAGERLGRLIEKEFGCHVVVREIKGLQVRDASLFRSAGVRYLFEELDTLTRDWSRDEIQLNATGGFKGVVPYLVLYGMFHGLPVCYVYEQSSTLIRLATLPIEFDWARLAGAAEVIFDIFSRGKIPEHEWRDLLPPDYYARRLEYDALFELEEGRVDLSALGYLMHSRLEGIEETAEVLLSPMAGAELDAADGAAKRHFEFMLARVRDPLFRSGYRHAESLHKTDLRAWKRYSSSGPRMLYWVESRRVYVARLFDHHDKYEYYIGGNPASRADFDLEKFIAYMGPRGRDYARIAADLHEAHADANERMHALEDEIRDLKLELRTNQAQLNRAVAAAKIEARERAAKVIEKQRAQHQEVSAQRKRQIRELRQTIATLEQELQDALAQTEPTDETGAAQPEQSPEEPESEPEVGQRGALV